MESFKKGLQQIYEKTSGSPEVCIAVLDTNINLGSPKLQNAPIEIIRLGDFEITAEKSHGTHVAGIIWGNEKGIAPGCKGLYIPVYEDVNARLTCSQERLADAIFRAVSHGARIINISGGMLSPADSSSLRLQAAVNYCYEKRVQIVAAVGNDGCDCLHVPASMPHVLAAGALDQEGRPYSFNNYGWVYQQQGILVPLPDTDVVMADNTTVSKAASSYAAPVVSGLLGLLCSIQLMHNAEPDPVGIKEIFLSTSDICPLYDEAECKKYLSGTVNLQAAYQKVLIDIQDLRKKASLQPDTSQKNNFNHERKRSECDMTSSCSASSELSVQPSSHISVQKEYIYTLGLIDYTVSSEEVKLSLSEEIGSLEPDHFLKVLESRDQQYGTHFLQNPNHHKTGLYYAQAVQWVLTLDNIPVFVLQPHGPFANLVYERLRDFMAYQLEFKKKHKHIDHYNFVRSAMAGTIAGTTRLMNGMEVPVVIPELRSMRIWDVDAFLKECAREEGATEMTEDIRNRIMSFLERVFFALQNRGILPEDRAINFSATNAFLVSHIFRKACKEKLELKRIYTTKSSLRPDKSTEWEVVMEFFNPLKVMEEAATVFRFTVNVGEVIPTLVGPVQSWKV